MSKYTLMIKDNINCKNEIIEATQLLQNGDYLSIFAENNKAKENIIDAIEEESLTYKFITEGSREYIIAKKDNNTY